MPLSDHEQRLLEQMERALYAEDPKFADSLRKTRRATVDRKRIALGIVATVLGLGVLLAGAVTQLVPVGVVGFLIMLAGAVVAYRAYVAQPATTPAPGVGTAGPGAGPSAPPRPAARKPVKSSGGNGFMDRLEERWRKRREDRGGQF